MGACNIYNVARMMTIDPQWLEKRIEEHTRNGNREMLAAAQAAQLRLSEMQKAKAAGLSLRAYQDQQAEVNKAWIASRKAPVPVVEPCELAGELFRVPVGVVVEVTK